MRSEIRNFGFSLRFLKQLRHVSASDMQLAATFYKSHARLTYSVVTIFQAAYARHNGLLPLPTCELESSVPAAEMLKIFFHVTLTRLR